MDTLIFIIVLILLLAFISVLMLRNNSLKGGLPTNYSGNKAYIVDVLMDAVYDSSHNISVANINSRLADKIKPEDQIIVQKFIRELIYGVVSGGTNSMAQLEESFPALIEAMASLYFDKDCFIHDFKFYNGGSYNAVIEVKCSGVGNKFKELGIPNNFNGIIRTFRCRYNYLPNRTLTTKNLITQTLMQLRETSEILAPTGRIYKPIYGSMFIPKTSTEAPKQMTLLWHLYPKFNKLEMPLDTSQIIDYMICVRDLAITLHKHGLVYGDWKLSNFMNYNNKIILTDVEMTKISDVLQKHWYAISHGVSFDMRKMELTEDIVIKIDNFALIKDLVCIMKSKASTKEELDRIIAMYPEAREHPYHAMYNLLVASKSIPTTNRFGMDLMKHGPFVFNDKTMSNIVDHMIRLLSH